MEVARLAFSLLDVHIIVQRISAFSVSQESQFVLDTLYFTYFRKIFLRVVAIGIA